MEPRPRPGIGRRVVACEGTGADLRGPSLPLINPGRAALSLWNSTPGGALPDRAVVSTTVPSARRPDRWHRGTPRLARHCPIGPAFLGKLGRPARPPAVSAPITQPAAVALRAIMPCFLRRTMAISYTHSGCVSPTDAACVAASAFAESDWRPRSS
jgi:hypothetical protein